MNWKPLLSSRRSGQKAKTEELSRSAFEQDYDRIIFSHPFRRLQDKTQVHPLPENDFVHTRLTHSLEVSSVGRSLGRKAGEVIVQRHAELKEDYSRFDFGAIVAAAALAHDLGNPPFGHAGEDALSDFFLHHEYGRSFKAKVSEEQWADLIKFEGNAQGFRIINSKQYGLRLTEATLGAFTKYPCPAFFPSRNKERKSQKKYGFFQSEINVFGETAEHLQFLKIADGAWCRHPLAFLVEAADDICYSIIDLEDGCRLGLVSFQDTVELLAAIIKQGFDPQKLERISGQHEKVAVLRALAINKLVDECSEIFMEHEKEILDGSFDLALTDQTASRSALNDIVNISVQRIYRSRNVVEIEAAGHEVLPGLLHEFIMAGEHLQSKSSSRKYANLSLLLPTEIRRKLLENAVSSYEMLRSIIDFVSGMTDKNAISLHRKIRGVE